MTDPLTAIANMFERARDGLEAGKEVSINAVGTRGWIGIRTLEYSGPMNELLTFTGAWAENEGAIFHLPAAALLAVRVAEPRS